MKQKTDQGFGAIGLIVLGAVIFGFAITAMPVLKSEPPAHTSDWLGFAGGAVGGVMTLVAAGVAWIIFKAQIAEGRRIQTEREETAAHAAKIVITPAVHAAAVLAKLNEELIARLEEPMTGGLDDFNKGGRANEAAQNLEAVIPQLKSTLGFFAVGEAWRDLEINLRSLYLIVTSLLHGLLSRYENPPRMTSPLELAIYRKAELTQLQTAIKAFDAELGEVFDRDSGM